MNDDERFIEIDTFISDVFQTSRKRVDGKQYDKVYFNLKDFMSDVCATRGEFSLIDIAERIKDKLLDADRQMLSIDDKLRETKQMIDFAWDQYEFGDVADMTDGIDRLSLTFDQMFIEPDDYGQYFLKPDFTLATYKDVEKYLVKNSHANK